MISKRQRIFVFSMFVLLLLLSLAAVGYTHALHNLAPMLINDSSLGLAGKLTDDDRSVVYQVVQRFLSQETAVVSILVVLWAAFTGVVIWRWSKKDEIHVA
jgi:hypothetical protein